MAAFPIRIVPLHAGPTAPAAAPHLSYQGGPLLASVQVCVFYWGDFWARGPAAQLAKQLDGFFDYVLTSPLMDQLAEYDTAGAVIGHGSRVGSVQIAGAAPASVTDADVQQLIQDQINSAAGVPQPGASTLYYVYLPSGTAVSMSGGASCQNFCGYHDDINGQIFYAVMPYPDCSGCTGGLALLDALTSTTSHELCEAVTDPIPGQGWYDSVNGEIGDICAWKTKKLGNYIVQLEWSNRTGACV